MQFGASRAHLAGTALAGLPVHITEFNTSYRPDNPIHDTAYHAAYLAPVLTSDGDHAASFSYWTFSDVFEESNITTAFFHDWFGLLTHRQVAKPTDHLYTFMALMGAQVLARGDDHLACRDPSGRVTVLAWQPVGGTNAPAASERHEVHLSVPLTGAPCPDGTGVFMLRDESTRPTATRSPPGVSWAGRCRWTSISSTSSGGRAPSAADRRRPGGATPAALSPRRDFHRARRGSRHAP